MNEIKDDEFDPHAAHRKCGHGFLTTRTEQCDGWIVVTRGACRMCPEGELIRYKVPDPNTMLCKSCGRHRPGIQQSQGGGQITSWPCECGGNYVVP